MFSWCCAAITGIRNLLEASHYFLVILLCDYCISLVNDSQKFHEMIFFFTDQWCPLKWGTNSYGETKRNVITSVWKVASLQKWKKIAPLCQLPVKDLFFTLVHFHTGCGFVNTDWEAAGLYSLLTSSQVVDFLYINRYHGPFQFQSQREPEAMLIAWVHVTTLVSPRVLFIRRNKKIKLNDREK